MPKRKDILASLKEDGYDVNWEQLRRGQTWVDCSCCGRGMDGDVGLIIGGEWPAQAVLCFNRRECRQVRDGTYASPMKAPLEDVVIL